MTSAPCTTSTPFGDGLGAQFTRAMHAFATAARELCEETDGAFGSAEEVAQRLRHEWASARGAPPRTGRAGRSRS